MNTVVSIVLILSIVIAAAAEIGARLYGIRNIPTYGTSETIGYIPLPNQSGLFLGKYTWAFNDRHMGVDRDWAPSSDAEDVVLLGDSIVYGWPVYSQDNRLGPQLELALPGSRVWPISADSWGILNELTYLAENPDVRDAADRFLFVLNTGDFGQASQWTSDIIRPRKKPASAAFYAFQRWVMPKSLINRKSTVPEQSRDWHAELSAFASAANRPIDIFLYPSRQELSSRDQVKKLFPPELWSIAASIHVVGTEDGWSDEMYRDEIHPKPAANAQLRDIIAGHLVQDEPTAPPASDQLVNSQSG